MTISYSSKLPNEPIFRRLVENNKTVHNVIVHDPSCGVNAKYPQLLRDILALRQRLYECLPVSMFDEKGRMKGDNPYILILSRGNYEFIVAAFSVLAIGGALVPLGPNILPEEALHFLRKCESGLILASSPSWQLATEIQQYADAKGHNVTIQPISPREMSSIEPSIDTTIDVDEEMTIASTRPSLILFTSGTTGPPKGVVHSRRFFYHGYGTSDGDIFLTHRPVHWIGGLRSIINLVISGTRQEMIDSHEAAIWERLRKGGVTMLCCVIPMWWKMMNHFKDELSRLPAAELDEYVRGARGIRVARLGGASPTPSLLQFWRETVGIPLEVSYGCTETGGPGLMTDSSTDRRLERCLGKPEKGVTVKFSDGDHGEILIKTAVLFSRYLDDDEATQAAFTTDGFYKTGDYAHLVNGEYVIDGRTSTDFVRYHGFKVPIIEVEIRLMELPFISEACIVSIPDKEASTRVAALVRFHQDFPSGNLVTVRKDLSEKLSHYKLPTALRVLRNGEEIPLTVSGK
ncbi:hypothetical protein MMC31_006723, partial [Peltigera leucophlebia]|nr:hypothetical protein [Peltigera leucophlebia]